jgi:mono/diheme cytochrome c family protein
MRWPKLRARTIAIAAACWLALPACRLEMHDQPRYEPLQASTFFADGRSARPLVEGTVAQGQLREDELLYTGRLQGEPASVFPFPITRQLLSRGQERFNIYCSPCHGRLGNGQGIIPQRGFRQPPSYHTERLRQAPAGHFFDVMTNGFGAMYEYGSRVPPEDRWAIIAYIRALQLSQHATLAEAPEAERGALEASRKP